MVRYRIFAILLLFLAGFCAGKMNITFAFTSEFLSQLEPVALDDTPSDIGGVARLNSAIKELRQTEDRFILLDTGNHFGGYIYRVYHGEPETRLMNDIRYDAMAVAGGELSLGEDIFDEWAHIARFPLIASNISTPPQNKIARHVIPYTTTERSGIIVGAFSLLPGDAVMRDRLPKEVAIDGDFVAVARRMVNTLSEKCDIIVLLSQLDIEANLTLAQEVCEIDLIIASRPDRPETGPIVVRGEGGCRTIITFAGYRGTRLGILKTVWDDGGVMVSHKWSPAKIDDAVPPDALAYELIESYIARLPASRVVCSTAVELDGRDAVLRGAESNLGNLIADAMLSTSPAADIALLPAGAFFGDKLISPGVLTERDILEILPFGESVVSGDIVGEDLEAVFERSVCCISNSFAGFLQIAGAEILIDTTQSPQVMDNGCGTAISGGSRVRKVVIGDKKLDRKKIYKIVTTDYAVSGGYCYPRLEGLPVENIAPLTGIVIDYLEKQNIVSPGYEGRIRVKP